MTRAWRIVIMIVLAMLALGVLLGGAGLLTGASWPRVWSQLSGPFTQLQSQLEQTVAQLPLP